MGNLLNNMKILHDAQIQCGAGVFEMVLVSKGEVLGFLAACNNYYFARVTVKNLLHMCTSI